jgi:pimeloyl-ACP methyl ester carboxylesterase
LVVFPAWWVSHLEHDLEDPAFREFFARFTRHLTVVRYDRPGVGLSDRERPEHSLEDEVENLRALVAELGTERFALFGGSCGGPPAIAYAAQFPERVTHLILYGAYAHGPTVASQELQQAMVGLVRAHWGLGSKALTDLFAPRHTTEQRQRIAESQRKSASAETAAAMLELIYGMDVSQLLAQIRVPTLVLHRKGDRSIGFEHGRQLAATIANATFVPLEGEAHLPWLGDWEAVADAALSFLVPDHQPAIPAELRSAENQFVREGEVWSLAFGGRRCHLKHTRGLADLALLLAHAGEELSAAQLMDIDSSSTPHADPILDQRARADIRERLRLLERTIADSQGPDAERASAERTALLRELRVATGLGGRRRRLNDATERARKAVSARIRETIEKIRGALPELAQHFDASISTGSRCMYKPAHATEWRI